MIHIEYSGIDEDYKYFLFYLEDKYAFTISIDVRKKVLYATEVSKNWADGIELSELALWSLQKGIVRLKDMPHALVQDGTSDERIVWICSEAVRAAKAVRAGADADSTEEAS